MSGCHHCGDQPTQGGDVLAALIILINGMEQRIMANMTELKAKLAELVAANIELAKDLQRLIAEGNTAEAIARVQSVIDSLAEMDAAIEAVSPEPAGAPVEPPVEPTEPAEPVE